MKIENDRIVGGITMEATEATVSFYATFVDGEILKTDAKTAEMAKLTENSLRDTSSESDLIVSLVSHKVFKSLEVENKIVFDFCGVMKN